MRRQWRQPALSPPQSSAMWVSSLAYVELLCFRLQGIDLSAMGRVLNTTGHSAAQVWNLAEFKFEGVLPGRLADLECMLP
jgi:hypothetical protein